MNTVRTKKQIIKALESRGVEISENTSTKLSNKAVREGFDSGLLELKSMNQNPYKKTLSPNKAQPKKYYHFIDGIKLAKILK